MNWFSSLAIILLFSRSEAFEYSETASITYLPNHNILADINFKLAQDFPLISLSPVKELGLFPSLIYTLPTEFGLQEGKLSFTRGIWDSSLWSKAPNNPTSSGFQFHGHFKENYQDLS